MPQETMRNIFKLKVKNHGMLATLTCSNINEANSLNLTEEDLLKYFKSHNIVFGIDQQAINRLLKRVTHQDFPMTIAKGIAPVDGKDGYLEYNVKTDERIKVAPDEKVNFRDLIRIPTVQEHEKIATAIPPVEGKDGKDVFGKRLPHRKGKAIRTRAGKNVEFREADQSFYATSEGQISISDYKIEVHPVYEVHESLSMKTGNIDFVGTVIIRGDVPTGYEVKAGGDVKVFGLVEAAQIKAEGSVFISEGLAGLQKGTVDAKGDVHIGYVNQGNIHTEGSIYVEQSIVHSICKAEDEVICRLGNIIGGSITAGRLIEAKDVGNRLSTRTKINFPLGTDYFEEKEKLIKEKEKITERVSQLREIGEKLTDKNLLKNPQFKEMFKKQRQSLIKARQQLEDVNHQINVLENKIQSIDQPKLIVRQTLYPQVIVSFGKYKRNFISESSYIYVTIEENEIVLHAN